MFFLISIFIFILAFSLSAYSRFNALLVLIPLSVYSQSSTIFTIGERGINIGLDTIYIFVFIIFELYKATKRKISLKVTSSSFALILLFTYFLLNALYTALTAPNGIAISGLIVYIRLFQYVPLFIILSNTEINFSQTKHVINMFIWTGISATALALYQKLSGNYNYMKGMPSFTMPIFREENIISEVGKYSGSGNYNVFAAFLLFSIFLTFVVWFSRKDPVFNKKTFFIYLVVLFIGLFLAKSRAAILGLIVGIISLNLNRNRILLSLKILTLFTFLIIIIGFIFRDTIFIKNLMEIVLKFKEVLPYALSNTPYNSNMGFSGDTLGAITRIFGYSEAIRVWVQSPIFGCGFDQILSHSIHYPENLFLQILAETGITGLFLYLMFIYRIYFDSERISTTITFNKHYVNVFKAVIISIIFINMTGATLLIQNVWGPFLLFAGFFYGYQRTTLKENITDYGR